uniref:asparagine synthase (glutamine-hydrolyzing) n=1 Tax=viral metagenome TaxID=1070528 RepID=A0A6C0EE93_9ZZZZ
MCGIFTLLNNNNTNYSNQFIIDNFNKGRGRGPEFSKLERIGLKQIMGFHRLAINGLNSKSNQPMIMDDITLICNGEIYNYKELYEMMDVTPTTDSDCEVIIHLYKRYGIDQTLQMLDGVFAFILCDYDINNDYAKTYIARDPYGVRPLYFLYHENGSHRELMNDNSDISLNNNAYENKNNLIGFASEIKMLYAFKSENHIIEHFEPGTYSLYILPHVVSSDWIFNKKERYHTYGFNTIMYNIDDVTNENDMMSIYRNIQYYLTNAIKKRCYITERPIACLLSGGLDSSLVTALVNEYHKDISSEPLETYSIGLEGSEDLKYAKIVADYLGTKHTEILLKEEDFISAINEVIYTIESYDTTTVRASIGNYLLGKYISENSSAKVIFNGDGSDELCGGYLYMHACPDELEFDKETRRLLKNIHAFDVLRSDKCISSHGLEPRTPFLDRSWVQYYLSIHPSVRFHPKNKLCEKYLLRTAFSKTYFKNSDGVPLLPDEIIWRTKEAFSDGVSKNTRSLYEIIQDYILTNIESEKKIDKNIVISKAEIEKKYYKFLFNSFYKDVDNIIPHYWMPKYVNATDASARTLDIYSKLQKKENKKETDIIEIDTNDT